MSLLRYFRLTARSKRAYAVYVENAAGYSTNEVSTGLTWIDGETIYRKVVSMGALPNTATKAVAHGISSIGQVVSLNVMATNGTGTWRPMPYVSSSGADATYTEMDGVNLAITAASDWSDHTAIAIIEYTKS